MHLECLPAKGQKALGWFKNIAAKKHLILAGGTALALQLGHRISVDLDFFTMDDFSSESLIQEIKRLKFDYQILQEEAGSLTVIVNSVKVSVFRYHCPFTDLKVKIKSIPVASILDIAAMKVIAITQRGAKRDFADLYFILQDTPFRKVAANMLRRFGTERVNPLLIGKALVFFNDAEGDPEPQYLRDKPDWKDIKRFFKKNVKQIVFDLQNAKEELQQ
ncbi:MAG: nucleotidyl transferase AbiEii/AbiGii toxin family protein [Nitrospirae bacterium]|nr:nucleotidyl transferase AbiEii/AbiGii toxin family protein [Nitrospirota bacterium]